LGAGVKKTWAGRMTGAGARMGTMSPPHNVILPLVGRISNPNRCTSGTDGKEILPTRGRMTTKKRKRRG
jgi:hypothetical protein